MEKIKISNGIYWIDIPEADLRILCGCPADAVKHLKKQGLIKTVEKNGLVYETGPNAILLSDVGIQNRSFANLAEFPVLHMFYHQGMLLPEHPNNTGVRPMLIGREDQVRSQIDYIFRGNYGLADLQEINAAGLEGAKAEELLSIKRHFAFGYIRPTKELIDPRVLINGFVELRDGVNIRRLDVNLFELTYKGQKTQVDLNLGPMEAYTPPYHLGFHTVERDYFSVIHIGEGDGWDVNRPCMASILCYQGKFYLIDAGPNISQSLTALGVNINDIEGIFHTHAHDDHFAGLTALIHSDHRIKYYTSKLVRHSVVSKLKALIGIDEAGFNRFFDVQDLDMDRWTDIQGLEVMPVLSPHPVENNLFLFRTLWTGGYKTYIHLADTVSLNVLESMVGEQGISRDFFEKIKQDYLTPADLKKIDIGGGMIHGRIEDFATDQSGKIILSHLEGDLNAPGREVGSSAAFGTVDVLIPGTQEYARLAAFQHLRHHYPEALMHDLRLLLNFPLTAFNAGSILIRKGSVLRHVLLIVRGMVESIQQDKTTANILSTGNLIGGLAVQLDAPSLATFRALSNVRVLEIPVDIYKAFLRRNNKGPAISRHGRREECLFLRATSLFGDMTSYPVQSGIAAQLERCRFKPGGCLPDGHEAKMLILESGQMDIHAGSIFIETAAHGGFFGEESLFDPGKNRFQARFKASATGYCISAAALADIPVVRWKLLEIYHRRLRILEKRKHQIQK